MGHLCSSEHLEAFLIADFQSQPDPVQHAQGSGGYLPGGAVDPACMAAWIDQFDRSFGWLVLAHAGSTRIMVTVAVRACPVAGQSCRLSALVVFSERPAAVGRAKLEAQRAGSLSVRASERPSGFARVAAVVPALRRGWPQMALAGAPHGCDQLACFAQCGVFCRRGQCVGS